MVGQTEEMKPKKRICAGLLAHVDAGKTTLSEAMLFACGRIRTLGRVDRADTFLDHDDMERKRGITIYAKSARIEYGNLAVTLLDTPGHVDFSPEMERSLQVMDYAILVISGTAGVQAHTRTLWKLLQAYRVPVFLFVNKMDQAGCDRQKLAAQIRTTFGDACIDLSGDWQEDAAMGDEAAMEEYLENRELADATVTRLIRERKVFPLLYGSALRMIGVGELLDTMERYMVPREYPQTFGARVFKITRDEKGNRLSWLKITGGELWVRYEIGGDKITQIRLYNGPRFETAECVRAGEVCAVTGLTECRTGDGLGYEQENSEMYLHPVMTYGLELPEEIDPVQVLPKLRMLEEEEPQLHLVWDEQHHEIKLQIMGAVQMEILREKMKTRLALDVNFTAGRILYRETIGNTVEGVGHFEPLRHYAEVHLLMEPGEHGSGITVASSVSEDELAGNWQNLILKHVMERKHRGVLTGSPLTDVKITLTAGRAHPKHTEGGDFRQAVYRAVRQGLMQAQSVLLEPFYSYEITVPEQFLGRIMTDIDRLGGRLDSHRAEDGRAVLTGVVPVAAFTDYQMEFTAATKGQGLMALAVDGYYPCKHWEDVVAGIGYDPERDVKNTADSVFCAHGSGFVVPWYEVPEYMHLESCLAGHVSEEDRFVLEATRVRMREEIRQEQGRDDLSIGTEEIDEILNRANGANRGTKTASHKGISAGRIRNRIAARTIQKEPGEYTGYRPNTRKKDRYLLVDGYNILYAWDTFQDLMPDSIDGARERLLEMMSNYRATYDGQIIVVFDAYRVKGHPTESFSYHNIQVVYTKEAETADQYIEKYGHEHAKEYDVVVATSDGLEQIIIRGEGCTLLSARDLQLQVQSAAAHLKENYMEQNVSLGHRPFRDVPEPEEGS